MSKFSSMAGVFPGEVATAETRDFLGPEALFPEEMALVSKAVPLRVREFATGRWCARQALRDWAQKDSPLLPGPGRSPRWPEGFVGSISHARGFCGAAVARSRDFRSIGFDVERLDAVEPRLSAVVCTSSELAWLAELSPSDQYGLLPLLFSAKEAAFKAQFPVTEEFLDFHDVELRIDLDQRAFSARITPPSDQPTASFTLPGRFSVNDGLVLTGVIWLTE